jgi:hypothetical protein
MTLNYLNLTIVLAQMGRDADAKNALESAIRYASHGENSGGEEDLLPDEIHAATGRAVLYANAAVFRQALYYLRPVLDAAYRLIRFNDPDRLEIRTGLPKRLRAQRLARREAGVRPGRRGARLAAEEAARQRNK